MNTLFVERVKDYFGETIGMYFAFLDYYTSALVLPAITGVTFYLFDFHRTSIECLILLAVFNLIWSTAFMESWKRHASALAYHWGTTDIKIIGKLHSPEREREAVGTIMDNVVVIHINNFATS